MRNEKLAIALTVKLYQRKKELEAKKLKDVTRADIREWKELFVITKDLQKFN